MLKMIMLAALVVVSANRIPDMQQVSLDFRAEILAQKAKALSRAFKQESDDPTRTKGAAAEDDDDYSYKYYTSTYYADGTCTGKINGNGWLPMLCESFPATQVPIIDGVLYPFYQYTFSPDCSRAQQSFYTISTCTGTRWANPAVLEVNANNFDTSCQSFDNLSERDDGLLTSAGNSTRMYCTNTPAENLVEGPSKSVSSVSQTLYNGIACLSAPIGGIYVTAECTKVYNRGQVIAYYRYVVVNQLVTAEIFYTTECADQPNQYFSFNVVGCSPYGDGGSIRQEYNRGSARVVINIGLSILLVVSTIVFL